LTETTNGKERAAKFWNMENVMDDNWLILEKKSNSSCAKTWDFAFVSQNNTRTWCILIRDKEFLIWEHMPSATAIKLK
jgi:hypothetical protein